MASTTLLLVTLLKALVEIAALALLAQGVMRVLAGRNYRHNFAYRLFQVVAAPAVGMARALTPRFIGERYHGLVAFLLLFWLWLALVYAKASVCQAQRLACFAA